MEGKQRHEPVSKDRIDQPNEESREAELDTRVGAAALAVMVWSFIAAVAWAGVFEPWINRVVLPPGSIIAALFLFGLGPAVVAVGMWPGRPGRAE